MPVSADVRPAIPAGVKRKVLVEAGHRCAIPTCRELEVTIHHIVPWAKCREHEYENLIALCPNCHARADRGGIDRESLRLYKANLRFAHDKFSQFEIDVLFEADKGADIPMPPFMLLLIKRLLEVGYVVARRDPGATFSYSGVDFAPAHILITSHGRRFIREMGSREM